MPKSIQPGVNLVGGCRMFLIFYLFLLRAGGGSASSGVILIAPEAESQCFLLQQRLKSTPTDLWREGARLLLQLGPSQSGWWVQQNTRKHTPACAGANSSTSLLSVFTYLMNSFLFFLYRFLPLSKVERSLGRRNFYLTKTRKNTMKIGIKNKTKNKQFSAVSCAIIFCLFLLVLLSQGLTWRLDSAAGAVLAAVWSPAASVQNSFKTDKEPRSQIWEAANVRWLLRLCFNFYFKKMYDPNS